MIFLICTYACSPWALGMHIRQITNAYVTTKKAEQRYKGFGRTMMQALELLQLVKRNVTEFQDKVTLNCKKVKPAALINITKLHLSEGIIVHQGIKFQYPKLRIQKFDNLLHIFQIFFAK